ncbi:hypothetical protein DJ71_21470, partial [Halorubrum sp. E3]
ETAVRRAGGRNGFDERVVRPTRARSEDAPAGRSLADVIEDVDAKPVLEGGRNAENGRGSSSV